MIDLPAIVLDALEAFDGETAPLGLYASEEFRMKKDQPAPRLRNEGLRIRAALVEAGCCALVDCTVRHRKFVDPCWRIRCMLPDRRHAMIRMLRTSKIKVRKFGSSYRYDAHVKFEERWAELRVDSLLYEFWRNSTRLSSDRIDVELLVLIGFAAEARPFHQELAALGKDTEWERHGTRLQARTWRDRHERGFGVVLACWSHQRRARAEVPLPAAEGLG